MKRSLLLYAVALAIIMVLMKSLEYRYLLRKLDVEVYLAAVSLICMATGIWLGMQLMRKRSDSSVWQPRPPFTETNLLSDREAEVLRLMALGYSNQEIADQLFISIHTVKTHTSNLFAKLEVKRRTQAVLRARSLGLVP